MGDDHQGYFNSLPTGYRFEPRDAELVVYYLRNKVQNKPLPLHRILEVDVYNHNPDELHDMLPNYGEKIRYYLTPRNRRYPNGTRPKRSAGTGYWKACGAGKKVLAGKEQIGTKTTLVFYQGTHKEATKTNWIMQEYTLSEDNLAPRQYKDQNLLNEWVLCKIYHKDRAEKNGHVKPIVPAPEDIAEPVDEEPFDVEDYLVDYQPGNDQDIVLDSTLMDKSLEEFWLKGEDIVLDSTLMDKSLEEFWLKEEDIFFPTSGQPGEDQGIDSESIRMNKNNQEEDIWLQEEDILVPVPVRDGNLLPIQY